jgi:hypothetical protein
MKTILANTLALLLGLVIGSFVNMGLIMLGGVVIPPPAGVDSSDMESLKAGMHLFELKHFVSPFLAHALGTLAGAMVATRVAVSHKFTFAMSVGVLFLAGGVASVFMLPAPMWFAIVDVLFAYLPMAWLGWRLVNRPEVGEARG